jgi:hypothetical protein
MKWTVDVYHQRRRMVARYGVDAPTAAAIGGHDGTGWVVCRIARV